MPYIEEENRFEVGKWIRQRAKARFVLPQIISLSLHFVPRNKSMLFSFNLTTNVKSKNYILLRY